MTMTIEIGFQFIMDFRRSLAMKGALFIQMYFCSRVACLFSRIAKYSLHPSILKVNDAYNHENRDSFSFLHTTYEAVYLQIQSVDSSKTCPKLSIPVKILKENCDIFANKVLIDLGTSPNNLKFADVTPSFKRGDGNNF